MKNLSENPFHPSGYVPEEGEAAPLVERGGNGTETTVGKGDGLDHAALKVKTGEPAPAVTLQRLPYQPGRRTGAPVLARSGTAKVIHRRVVPNQQSRRQAPPLRINRRQQFALPGQKPVTKPAEQLRREPHPAVIALHEGIEIIGGQRV